MFANLERTNIVCPECGSSASEWNEKLKRYECKKCFWNSKNEDTLDISYWDEQTRGLSTMEFYPFEIDGVICRSLEGFLQSLRIINFENQKAACACSGLMTGYLERLAETRDDIKEVHWNNKKIQRESEEYLNLISRVYDLIFEQNQKFRSELLKTLCKKHIICSERYFLEKATLMTDAEYRYQIKRLRDRAKLEGYVI